MKKPQYELNILDINLDFYIVQSEQDDGKWVAIYHDVAYIGKSAAFSLMREAKELNPNTNYRVVKCKIERTVVKE